MTHTFRGDRFSRPELRGQACLPVLHTGGDWVAGSNGNRLVEWPDGSRDVVPGRAVRSNAKRPRKPQALEEVGRAASV